jgi:hypothetical protein
MPLHPNLDGMAGKGVLTGEAAGSAAKGGVDGENQ